MPRFFIDRPVFAWVLAILVMLAGSISILNLPIAQYPSIAPPAVTITATYPGASAKILEDTVTQIIEQKMKGLDRLQYISAVSDSSGSVTITLTFETGTDPDISQVQVQNKLSLATPLLPQEVQQQGLQVAKAAQSFSTIYAFTSETGQMTGGDLADYAAVNIQDVISRVDGVGDVTLFGSQHAMRIWLDADKLSSFNLTPLDIKNAVESQNVQIASGQLGDLPPVQGQQLNATITSRTRLKTKDEFENILLRTQSNGAAVYLRDVARVEIGNESYSVNARFNGKAAAGIAIKLSTGANALDTIKATDATMDELAQYFPKDMRVYKPYDTTPFVRISIEEVIKTLVEAIVLVFLVMYLFLQNFRATLIPTIAVPIVLLGTFGVLAALGYSINTLTMLAMVLAIGLLVDDAIVVVENVERVMEEDKLSPLEATRRSMGQISGALVGIALVLTAVFVPMAFFGGSTGVIYRQFTVTIVSAMILSVLVAMILTPALCATILKPNHKGMATSGFFGLFNRLFDRSNRGYQKVTGGIIKRRWSFLFLYLILTSLVVVGFMNIPRGFLPEEDQGTLFAIVQLPTGATQDRTLEVLKKIEHHYLEDEKDSVDSLFTVAGFSFAGAGQNAGLAFIRLKPWDERTTPEQQIGAITSRSSKAFASLRDAVAFPFVPPAVSELGNASGFDFMLQDRGNLGHEKLMAARNQLLFALSKEDGLLGVRPNGLEDTPGYQLDLDDRKLGSLGLSIADVNDTLSIAMGGRYINDFIDKGRVKKVFLQADAAFRMLPNDINRWYVRNAEGTMVPFEAFSKGQWVNNSPRLERYNGFSSVEIMGMAKPGTLSSGQAMELVEKHAAELPQGIGYEWTGMSFQEKQTGNQVYILYILSILVVFLCLAALYESWVIPLSVISAVPLGILGALIAALLTWKMNDVYFQVGILTTLGLTSKNAILIVEFAKELVAKGISPYDAAIQAARMRLRPILMTSLAFILGVYPMMVSTGAGSGAQNALGSAVIGGMISGTVLAVLFVPLFFVLVQGLIRKSPQTDKTAITTSIEGEQ